MDRILSPGDQYIDLVQLQVTLSLGEPGIRYVLRQTPLTHSRKNLGYLVT